MSARYPTRLGRDLAFILPGPLLAALATGLLAPLTALSAVTSVVWIGLLLFPLTLMMASAFAGLSRRRLAWWGRTLPPPRYRPRGPGVLGAVQLIADPRRWFDLAFEGLVALPLRTVTLALTLGWATAAAHGLTVWLWGRWVPGIGPLDAGQVVLTVTAGALLALAFPLVVDRAARLDAAVTSALLGGPRERTVAEPEDRVPVAPHAETDSGPDPSFSASAWTWMSVAFLAFVLVVVGWPVTAALYGVDPAIAMVLTFAHSAGSVLAVRWPWLGAGLSVLAALAMMPVTAPAASGWPWPWPVTIMLSHCLLLLVLSLRHRWYWALSAWSAGTVLTLGAMLGSPTTAPGDEEFTGALTNGVVLVSLSGAIVLLGLLAHQLVQVSGQVEEAETLGAAEVRRRRELEERNRIARELHDVVAHSMSVISVQAGTAKYRMAGLNGQVEQEFEDIAASSRQALGEMRSLLAVLRTEEAAATAPLPGLADLGELIASSRASGAEITAIGTGADDLEHLLHEVAPTVGLIAYRVVQEALSNALRHAPGAQVEISLSRPEPAGELVVEVVNTAPAHEARPAPGSGLGIAGTRERVASVGGRVEAAPTAEGGFSLRAHLPLTEQPEAP